MPLAPSSRRARPASRRLAYRMQAVESTALLFILNVQPGWQALPFLTRETSQVIGLVNFSLAADLVISLVYMANDTPWLISLGDLIGAGIRLAAAIRVWQVFPFNFHGSTGWSILVRVILAATIAGTSINMIVQAVSLTRRSTRIGRRPAKLEGPKEENAR